VKNRKKKGGSCFYETFTLVIFMYR
jgi:hypothetical protein